MSITVERYLMLYASHVKGVNLAPVDFTRMQELETNYGLDVSDSPNLV
jgi:hypothetical protein